MLRDSGFIVRRLFWGVLDSKANLFCPELVNPVQEVIQN